MAPALCMVSPVRQHSPVRAIPPCRIGLATGSIQPGKVAQAQCSRDPVRLQEPVYLVPPPRTSPPVATPRTRLSLSLLPTGAPACPALPGPSSCPALPESSVCPEPPEPPVSQEPPEPSTSQEPPEPSASEESMCVFLCWGFEFGLVWFSIRGSCQSLSLIENHT